MKPPPQSFSPSSPVRTGTPAATGAPWDTQQFTSPHVLNWYMCSDAASWPAESAGRCASQPLRSFDHARPPAMIGCVAPVLRTAFTSACMPAEVQAAPTPLPGLTVQPFSQHAQGSLVEAFPVSRNGSLNRSKTTDASVLNAVATLDQNAGAWSASAMGNCPVARVAPGAAQCRSRIAISPA